MSVHGRILARLYDPIMAGAEAAGLRAHRRGLLAEASGRVLEIGAGTGANVPFYGRAVSDLTITEQEMAMVRQLRERVREHAPQARVLRAPAEDLPFEDDSFDVAVSALVLCTVDDQPRALRELLRVLRTGGLLLFIEHVRADQPRLARWQDRLSVVNRILAGGCTCNRATLESISSAGFRILRVQQDTLRWAPPIVQPLVIGAAEVSRKMRRTPHDQLVVPDLPS